MPKMKICPVCGASCFDDMEMCFDCLHQFSGQQDASCGALTEGCEMASAKDEKPVVLAEYNKMPSDCSEGTGSNAHCVTLRIQLPEEAGEFSLRCENLQIEGVLLA